MPQDPIGTAHFESESAMTVPSGSSAMVSIMKAQADGEVVYLFDPDSPHGDESFPFKAIRLRNPTDSVLESGPVTVFAAGRFIGEGLVEPIPARSVAFVRSPSTGRWSSSARTTSTTTSRASSRCSVASFPPRPSTRAARS